MRTTLVTQLTGLWNQEHTTENRDGERRQYRQTRLERDTSR